MLRRSVRRLSREDFVLAWTQIGEFIDARTVTPDSGVDPGGDEYEADTAADDPCGEL